MSDMLVPYADGDVIRNITSKGFRKLSPEYKVTFAEEVTEVNLDPTVVAKTVTLAEDTPEVFNDAALLIGASDVEGEPVSVLEVDYTGDKGVLSESSGTYTFTPLLNFNGDVTLDFAVTDGIKVSRSTYKINYTPVNDEPQAAVTNLNVEGNTTLRLDSSNMLTGASDPEGNTLTLKTVTYVGANGVVVDNGDGTFDFTPTHGFTGDIILGFTITDSLLDSTSTLLTVTVDAAILLDVYNTLEVYSNLEVYTQ